MLDTVCRRGIRHIAISLSLVVVLSVPAAAQDGAAFFEKQIRPVLAEKCFVCHSSATTPAMGGLQLDTRAGLEKGGTRGPSIVDRNPEQSILIKALRYADEALRMPPTGKLTDSEIAAFERWVEMGAPWPEAQAKAAGDEHVYWSFVAPKEPPIPAVNNSGWVASPIDAFILAELEKQGLQSATPADKRTLIRRATFDLIGLPPKPDEIQAFLADESPEAFARVIDRLLLSPRYGERWGRHWLDVARYADSNGLDENLVYKNAFRYRDYVINAFNNDKPYDRFIHEQLAGDLLPPSDDLETTFERWTATGFLSLGAKMLAEDDPVKMQMDIVDEQLDTTARAFMGLTVGCARCHDHKFDPIPTADYYAMAGIFKSSHTMDHHNVVAKWHEHVLAPKEDRDRLEAHLEQIESKKKEIGRITDAENLKLIHEGWRHVGDHLMAASDVIRYDQIALSPVLDEAASMPPAGAVLRSAGEFETGNVNRKLEKGGRNIVEDSKGPYFAEYEVTVDVAGPYQIDFFDEEKGNGTADISINGILMKYGAEAIQNRAASPDAGGWSVAGIFPLNQGRNIVRLEHKNRFPYFEKILIAPNPLPAGTPVPKTLAQVARQYGVNPGFLDQWVERMVRSKGAPASVLLAWGAFESGKPLEGWTSPAAALFEDFRPSSREELAARYQGLFSQAVSQWQELHPESKLNFENERYKDGEENAGLPDAGLEALRKLLYEKFGPFRPPPDSKQYFPSEEQAQIAQLEAERKELEDATPEFPRAMGVREAKEIADIPIHIRGSHWTLGEIAPRGFLRAVSTNKQPAIDQSTSGRLQLARWITREDHPLTSRVMVNRLWRWHFGRGIVSSTDNFGRLGDKPTNQPLLDWLALRFIENGWSIKKMHRLIMLSNAYQMSTAYDPKAAEVDPENKLLWRMNRQRLEAEQIRDAIMAVSGDIDFKMGDSMLKLRDRQYVSNTARGGKIDYDRNVRAVYLPVIRSSGYDVFQAFDFADPSTSNGDRNSTVVAPQALFMMNGSVVLHHTRVLADKLLSRSDFDGAARIREAYERTLGRPPTPGEIDRALTFIARVDQALEDDTPAAEERRALAWQSFCKALIASNEFIYLN